MVLVPHDHLHINQIMAVQYWRRWIHGEKLCWLALVALCFSCLLVGFGYCDDV
jgi:hypothetical protein